MITYCGGNTLGPGRPIGVSSVTTSIINGRGERAGPDVEDGPSHDCTAPGTGPGARRRAHISAPTDWLGRKVNLRRGAR